MENKSLDLIVIDDTLEAIALRSVLDCWGVKVIAHYIGKAQDVVNLFQKQTISPFICIAAHGDEINNHWGFGLPELGEEIAKLQPYNKILFANGLSEFIKLKGQHVLSLACMTGNQEIADVFLKSGAIDYVAPSKAPFGHTSLYFALNFYYWLFAKEKSIKEAYEKSMIMIDKEIDRFSLFVE